MGFSIADLVNYIIGSIALIITTTAQFQTSMKVFRPVMIIGSAIWLYYCFLNGTWSNAVAYCINLLVNGWRFVELVKEGAYSTPDDTPDRFETLRQDRPLPRGSKGIKIIRRDTDAS